MAHAISDKTLRRFTRGTAAGDESRTVLSHLLAGCISCRRRICRFGGFESAETGDYDAALDRFEVALRRSVLELETTTESTEALLAELDRVPVRQQEILDGDGRRYCRPGLCEALVRRSFALRFRDLEECLRQARLGAVIGGRLEPGDRASTAERAEIAALRCRSLAQLSNALRIGGDLAGADAALASAHGILLQETVAPPVVAEVCEVSGALRCYQRRFAEALSFYDGALSIYRDLGDPGVVARALVGQAIAHSYSAEPEAALTLLWEALPKIGPGNPRLTLAACHTLISCLVDAGRIEEAVHYLGEAGPLFDQHGDRLTRLRRRWLEGKLRMGQGDYAAAARLLESAHRRYLALGMPYDAAVLSLDLATCHLVLGRRGEVRRLMQLAVPVFKSLGIERELLAALRLLARSFQSFELAATG